MSQLRSVLVAIIMLSSMGCAVNENTYWTITDSDAYWVRSGYSIKPPSGSYWVKQPLDEKYPNAISFIKGEGAYNRGSTSDTFIYFKGTVALAFSTNFDKPVLEKTDKKVLASALHKHLNRHWVINSNDTTYDALSGSNCLKYTRSSKEVRPRIGQSDLNVEQIKGYICLHPNNDTFGVIMESRNFTTTSGDISNRDDEIDHFFRSLTFTSLPTTPGKL